MSTETPDLRANGATNKVKGQVEQGLGKLTRDRQEQAKGKVSRYSTLAVSRAATRSRAQLGEWA
jgi:uncharacterized protein YjbJ (UPF0337 family)